MYGSVISSAAQPVSSVIRMTMPAVPTMNAFRWSLGASERHASAMTSALSPLRTTLMTAILKSAVHVSASLNAASIAYSSIGFDGVHKLTTQHYLRLSPALRAAFGFLTQSFREPYGALTGERVASTYAGNVTVNVLPRPSAS